MIDKRLPRTRGHRARYPCRSFDSVSRSICAKDAYLMGQGCFLWLIDDRCRANMAHIRQPRPDSGLGVQVKVLALFQGVASSLWSGGKGRQPKGPNCEWSAFKGCRDTALIRKCPPPKDALSRSSGGEGSPKNARRRLRWDASLTASPNFPPPPCAWEPFLN